jgi:uncharacterized protein (DUF2252 family)
LLGFVAFALLSGCGDGAADPRAAEIAGVLSRADEPLIRSRPALVAGKYARMASDPYSFYRGNVPIYRHDWDRGAFGLTAGSAAFGGAPELLAVGDPHPENFGVLVARDGSLALEPNDFDSADRANPLWDLRRLTTGMSLAAHLSNSDDPAARIAAVAASRATARAAAEAYAQEIAVIAKGGARLRLGDPGQEPVLVDAFKRSRRDTDNRRELVDLTEIVGGKRRLRRGVLSPDDTQNIFADLPASPYAALPAAIMAYRATLISPPPALDFTLLDAVRELGSGVASWPRVRGVLLVRGATDDPSDDLLLEIKELADAALPVLPPPSVGFDDVDTRVLATSRAAWAIPDAAPLWGTTSWVGLPCQIRLESSGQKTIRVSRLTGDLGTPEALSGLARELGRLLARAHGSPLLPGETPASRVAAVIGADAAAFADEQADTAERYAAQVLLDHALFVSALADLGPRLGVPADATDTPSPDLAALFGTPPPSP